jgi:hypothetical protein
MAGRFDEFIDLCDTVADYTAVASRNAYSKETHAATVSQATRAKITFANGRTVTVKGEDVPISATAWCPPPGYVPPGSSTATPTFAVNAHLTINSVSYTIVNIDTPYDETGSPHHQKLQLSQR